MDYRKHICLLVVCFIMISFVSCSKSSKDGTDEIYYGSDKQETTVTAAETVRYSIEKNKVITDDYSFGLPKGYEVKENEKCISAESSVSDITISVDSISDDTVTLEGYVGKRKSEIKRTGFEIDEPKEVEVNGIAFTEIRIGMPGKSKTKPIGCEYICEEKSEIIHISISGNEFDSIDICETEELLKPLNLKTK